MRASPESLSCVIVDYKYVLACRKVLNERSASQQYHYTYQHFPNIRKSNSVCMLKGSLRCVR